MKKVLLLVCLSVGIAACTGTDDKQLPEAKGMPCEVVVVMDEAVMKSDLRDSVKSIVECDMPGLGAGESIFRVNNISDKGYKGIFTVMHTQLFFEIDRSVQQPSVGIAYNNHAKPQISVFVKAPTVEQMRSFLSAQREAIQRAVVDFQLDRISTLTNKKYSQKLYNDVRRQCGYTIKMPADIIATKVGKQFVWGGANKAEKDINSVFYTLPWDGTEQAFNVERYVEQRDSVLRVNIPGSTPDQWMTTSRGNDGQPVVWPRLRMLQGKQTLEVHGLWELKGGFMGGPFVSLVRVDTARQQVVVAEGFVFNPNGAKRDLLRLLEGALRTATPAVQ